VCWRAEWRREKEVVGWTECRQEEDISSTLGRADHARAEWAPVWVRVSKDEHGCPRVAAPIAVGARVPPLFYSSRAFELTAYQVT
jgi:hypothetical protein